MKVSSWLPTAAGATALALARVAIPVLLAVAAGQRWDVALLAALGLAVPGVASKP